MSFREKTHWAAFLALAFAFGWYFLAYPWAMVSTDAGVAAVAGMLVPVTIIIVVVMVATATFFAIRAPKKRISRKTSASGASTSAARTLLITRWSSAHGST